MFSIRACPLPDSALLRGYQIDGTYTDCYTTEISDRASHEEFVAAFYTTPLFKLERFLLKWLVAKPSTDAQAVQLARGAIDVFAAWRVEGRESNQLLLCDFAGRTRSWLMVAPLASGVGTHLYFGSAVVPVKNRKTDALSLDPAFRALLGFHRIYSVLLLRAARSRLKEARPS